MWHALPFLYFWPFSENLHKIEECLEKDVLIHSNHLILSVGIPGISETIVFIAYQLENVGKKFQQESKTQEETQEWQGGWLVRLLTFVDQPYILFYDRTEKWAKSSPLLEQYKIIWLRVTFCL